MHYTKANKALPRSFGGAPYLSTTSEDSELPDGRKNRDFRRMFVQNVDKLKQLHDRGIEHDLLEVISVPELVNDQVTDVRARWDLSVRTSLLESWRKFLIGTV